MNITKITGISSGSRERKRELIRIRDNKTCQICGKVWIKGQRRFDIHHKDCDNKKSRQCDNLKIEKDNMITLCHKCHLNLPEHKRTMKVKTKIYLSYKQKNKIINYLMNGKRVVDISKIFGVSNQTISKYNIKLKRG